MDDTIIKIIIACVGIVVPFVCFAGYRLLSYYDDSIKELFKKISSQPCSETKERLAKIESDIEWIKKQSIK
jgi:hypothetical protein